MKEKDVEQLVNDKLARLSVTIDEDVLKNSSDELDMVNEYFDSVTCGNKEIENLLYEMIGYCLLHTSILSRAFILRGEGRNGKSVIARVIESILEVKDDETDDNKEYSKKSPKKELKKQCSHENLERLCGNKSGSKSTISNLEGCTVCILEDQKQSRYINASMITRIISGEPIAIEKNKEIVTNATLLFTVNEVVDFKETGIFITDRFCVIPFKNRFTDVDNNRNISIKYELCKPKSLQIIATRAIQAIKVALQNGKFTIPKIVEDETKKYFMECNNAIEFCCLNPIKYFITKSGYYDEYKKWCNYNNLEAVSNSEFGKKVLSLDYNEERYSFNGERKTYYVSKTLNTDDCREIYNKYLRKACKSEETIENHNGKDLAKELNCIPFNKYLDKSLYDELDDIEVSL